MRALERSVIAWVLLAGTALAQSTGTIGGRITDQSGASMPGVSVTVTNIDTGVVREGETNAEGLYNVPALQPGTYSLRVALSGFAPQERQSVVLITGSTLSADFTLTVAALAETLTVSGQAPLVETTQHDVAKSVQLAEVQSLPMLNRNFVGLITLIPGARPTGAVNTNKRGFGGAIAIGGGTGRNVETKVDGLDNRDDTVGGTLFNYTIEGIQEFKVLAHDFGAQYGRTSGGVVIVTTRSGTNALRGTAFGYGRNAAMTAIDHFTKASGFANPPYTRQQFGGSLGGRIVRDRMFFFGAVERVREDRELPVPRKAYDEALILKQALMGLASCPECMTVGNAIVPESGMPQTVRDLMYTTKFDYQLNPSHALLVRFAQQRLNTFNESLDTATPHPDSDPSGSNAYNEGGGYSVVTSHTWVIGAEAVNTFAFQQNHFTTRQFCNCGPAGPRWALRNLTFPSLQVGVVQNITNQDYFQDKTQFKNDYARQVGRHSLKIGGEFAFYSNLGVRLAGSGGITQGAIRFFDDPTTILANTVRYPQGFLTPGAAAQIIVGDVMLGGPPATADIVGQKQLAAYVQDDWKMSPRLTLSMGLRYDLQINGYNQRELPQNRTYLALKAIGSPYGGIPRTPAKDVSPRVGVAWDITGDARNLVRAGVGLYFDQMLMISNFRRAQQSKATLANIAANFVNSTVGVGQVASYVYGISPLPPGPLPGATQLRPGAGSQGDWYDPDLGNPYNRTYHIGYARQMTERTALSIDYTHVDFKNDIRNLEINPIEGAWDPNAASYNTCGATGLYRRLQCAFQATLGDPRILGGINAASGVNSGRFDELLVHLENRHPLATFQASYTLSGAFAYGGAVGGATGGSGPALPVNQDQPFAPGEWGPTLTDERHRAVLSGVFNVPGGAQVAPIFQIASARPYNLLAGRDLNGDGQNTDRYIDPQSGQMVGINSGRGSATWNFDARVTKFFEFGDARRLGVFAEFYNITNKANFGNIYNGNALASTFRQPTGFLPAYPTSRQLQLGARFSF